MPIIRKGETNPPAPAAERPENPQQQQQVPAKRTIHVFNEEPQYHELVVVITGDRGSGKTTVARIIEEALAKAGFEFAVNLDPDKDEPQGLYPIETPRLKRFGKRCRVRIQTLTTIRPPQKR